MQHGNNFVCSTAKLLFYRIDYRIMQKLQHFIFRSHAVIMCDSIYYLESKIIGLFSYNADFFISLFNDRGGDRSTRGGHEKYVHNGRKISAKLSYITVKGQEGGGLMRYRFSTSPYLGWLFTNVCICNGQ